MCQDCPELQTAGAYCELMALILPVPRLLTGRLRHSAVTQLGHSAPLATHGTRGPRDETERWAGAGSTVRRTITAAAPSSPAPAAARAQHRPRPGPARSVTSGAARVGSAAGPRPARSRRRCCGRRYRSGAGPGGGRESRGAGGDRALSCGAAGPARVMRAPRRGAGPVLRTGPRRWGGAGTLPQSPGCSPDPLLVKRAAF